jgi:hypothetical protein
MWVGGWWAAQACGGQCRLRVSDRLSDKHNHDIDACKQDLNINEKKKKKLSRGEM